MLKTIPAILTPELLKIMMEMGHGDELVIGDGNFPAASCGKRLVRLDGHGVEPVLDAVLTFFPLDYAVDAPVAVMDNRSTEEPPIWARYRAVIQKHEGDKHIESMERFAFYERSRSAYAIVATGEAAVFANIILKKGVVR